MWNWLFKLGLKLFFKYILTPDNIDAWTRELRKVIEDYVLGTKSKIDDAIVLPALITIEKAIQKEKEEKHG